MKVGVIGVGHVGLVTAACAADLGHEVIGMDDDPTKVTTLKRGEVPFYEEGLAELVADTMHSGRLRITGDAAEAVAGADVVFICVGTPAREDGSPNLSYVQAAAAAVAAHATGPVVVVEKSTVPVRTGERLRHALNLESQARGGGVHHEVVSNPEFTKEGTAVADTLRPDRIVVGADSDRAHEIMRALYQPLLDRYPCPYVATDVRTAELIKHASNAYLATKISFINAVARICEITGADVQTVADAMGHDPRIGRAFLNAGPGYGGSCFPKDVQAFIHIAAEIGYDFGLLRETDRTNREARQWPLTQVRRLLWNLDGKQIAVLGLAFKAGTDDIRDSVALEIIDALRAEGAHVRLHDPVALDHVRSRYPDAAFCDKAEDALAGAHAVIVCTEWDEYRAIAPERLHELLEYPIVVDARNIWSHAGLTSAGLTVASVGSPLVQVPGA
jgi:UDPglucose 6-dehydrogenase